MPNLYTVPPGHCVATRAVRHFMLHHPQSDWPRAVILVPSRRSVSVVRRAFMDALDGYSALLPRLLPLADVGNELLSLLGAEALPLLEKIPAEMSEAQHRYLLASYVEAFERKRLGSSMLAHSLALTDSLVTLQERAIRQGCALTREALVPLMHADFADHWKQSLEFLSILTDHWPEIERTSQQTTQAAREVQLITLLADYWQNHPASYPVYVIGSTASQPATAQLLHAVAEMASGTVILPGLDPSIREAEWACIAPGHPYFHLKQFLDHWPISPKEVQPLAESAPSIWLEALAPREIVAEWRKRALPSHSHLALIPCAHGEEEVRVIILLLREGLENPQQHTALITPDEGLMERVAVAMLRYGVQVDRISRGTLATTRGGSLWLALLDLLMAPDRPLYIRNFLHHPLLSVSPELLSALEPGWRGINRLSQGKLPRLAQGQGTLAEYKKLTALIQSVVDLYTERITATDWLQRCEELIHPFNREGWGEAVEEALAQLSHAERFGRLDATDFAALVRERLDAPSRDIGLSAHPHIHLLTPVEARLQRFDRVILAGMQDALWPGEEEVNPWLNRAAEATLGLPSPNEHVSLIAHDLLMHGSGGEVFLTYARRDGESPAPRSRFIEKLVTLLAVHGVGEAVITRREYIAWATALDASDTYAPEAPATPRPTAAERPTRLQVTDIERLSSDPHTIYAKYVLRLAPLKEIDALPDASDFGNLAHKAIERLEQHWNQFGRPAEEGQLAEIAGYALRELSARPNIDLFWRRRLLNGLHYINRLEAVRRLGLDAVESEQVMEVALETDLGKLTLYGRIDRLEQRPTGVSIIDHKTGSAPKERDILEGEAPQLLTYALMLEALGQSVESVEIWQLPKRGEEGEITRLSREQFDLAAYKQQLITLLETMRNPAIPFLAKPLIGSSEFAEAGEFDGISRYDEWAGLY